MSRPARAAALKRVVEVEQIPPPRAPVGCVRPLMMAPPERYPFARVTDPTASQKSKVSPGSTTVPLIAPAGILMLAPNPLRSLGSNLVVHVDSRTIRRARRRASGDDSIGATDRDTTSTGADAGSVPAALRGSATRILATVASTSRARPSRDDPVATIRPPRRPTEAFLVGRPTFLVRRAMALCTSPGITTGASWAPADSNRIHDLTVDAGIVQVSITEHEIEFRACHALGGSARPLGGRVIQPRQYRRDRCVHRRDRSKLRVHDDTGDGLGRVRRAQDLPGCARPDLEPRIARDDAGVPRRSFDETGNLGDVHPERDAVEGNSRRDRHPTQTSRGMCHRSARRHRPRGRWQTPHPASTRDLDDVRSRRRRWHAVRSASRRRLARRPGP